MSTTAPPENVRLAAAQVETWLKEQETATKTPAEIASMSAADRIDYCRRFDQSKLPAWKDPRS